MAAALLGLVLDSSTAIAAERSKQSPADLIESIFRAHGAIDLSLSPVTVAELVHGIFRARTSAAAQARRLFVQELVSLIPVHPFTKQTGWLMGQIEGEEIQGQRAAIQRPDDRRQCHRTELCGADHELEALPENP